MQGSGAAGKADLHDMAKNHARVQPACQDASAAEQRRHWLAAAQLWCIAVSLQGTGCHLRLTQIHEEFFITEPDPLHLCSMVRPPGSHNRGSNPVAVSCVKQADYARAASDACSGPPARLTLMRSKAMQVEEEKESSILGIFG